MFGNDIPLTDLIGLLNAIRSKDLILQVKILDQEWENISPKVVKRMIETVHKGTITHTDDIRLRLFAKK